MNRGLQIIFLERENDFCSENFCYDEKFNGIVPWWVINASNCYLGVKQLIEYS